MSDVLHPEENELEDKELLEFSKELTNAFSKMDSTARNGIMHLKADFCIAFQDHNYKLVFVDNEPLGKIQGGLGIFRYKGFLRIGGHCFIRKVETKIKSQDISNGVISEQYLIDLALEQAIKYNRLQLLRSINDGNNILDIIITFLRFDINIEILKAILLSPELHYQGIDNLCNAVTSLEQKGTYSIEALSLAREIIECR